MNILKVSLGFIHSICIIIICLFTAVCLPTFYTPFYSYEYDKNGVYSEISASEDELMAVTAHLLGYMKGEKQDLHVTATVAGEQRAFFNEREMAHMVDVKGLFDVGFLLRNVAVAGFILTLLALFLMKCNPLAIVAKSNQIVISAFLGLLLCLCGYIALDFDKAFTLFHELFFTNDLWQLNPDTDLLLNMVPLPFFIDIATVVAILFFVMMIVVVVVSTLIKKHIIANMGEKR